jgi:hypothetical protein
MKRLLIRFIFLPGCSWFQSPEIVDPTTGKTYKGKAAVQVYAHSLQQEQLKERWTMLSAMATKETGQTATAQATHNMLLQSLVFMTQGSSGGDYFKMLAEKARSNTQLWSTALAVLGPAAVHYLLYGGSNTGSGVSSEVEVGRDLQS